jgi:hypothetical protein
VTLTSHDIIRAMLRSYQDVCGPGDRSGGADPSDDRILLMNPLWRMGTFPELTRCLIEQRSREPQLYWHISHRYLRAERRQVRDHCPVCRQPSKTVHTHRDKHGLTLRYQPTDVMLEVWHPRVEARLVDRGIDWLVEEHRGPPFLPSELYAMIAA